MRTCTLTLRGISPYSASRKHNAPKKNDKEGPAEYDERTWREKCHYTEEGNVFIPAEAFSFGIKSTAKKLSLKVPGKGNKLYTNLFLSGILITDPLVLPETRETVQSWTGSMNANGVRGSGTRVDRTFPMVHKWGGTIEVYILDDAIPNDIFERVAKECGKLNGVGRYRPENGGTNGRFVIEKFVWSEVE